MHPTGSYPNAGEMANVTACASSFSGDCCQYSHDIQVKNCTDFLVYKLQPVVHCNQAYCFGKFSVYILYLFMKYSTLISLVRLLYFCLFVYSTVLHVLKRLLYICLWSTVLHVLKRLLYICLWSTVFIVLVRLLYICLFVYEVQYFKYCLGKVAAYLFISLSTYCLGKVAVYLFISLWSTVIIVLVRLLYICLFVYEVQYLLSW